MKLLGRVLAGVIIVLALAYLGDWAVWRLRVARGGGVGHVEVSRLQVASLKGNKEEYYPDGTEVVECSESVLPWTAGGACWWVQRHRTVFER